MKFVISKNAHADLRSIVAYIAEDKPNSARSWLKTIYEKFETLAAFPQMGVERSDIRANLRLLPYGNYLILYNINDDIIEIIRIVHGALDWQNLLG